jgi:hypothetical protein
MSVAPDSFPSPAVPALSFAGTVDCTLIHRRNPSEAFVTDAVRTSPRGFAAAALLPPAHPHYAAHTGPSRARDPMLLLECARQAVTYAAHAVFGVELDAHFVVQNWSAEFAAAAPQAAPAPQAVPGPRAAPGQAALVITAVTRNPRLLRGRVRGLDYEMELWAAGVRAGRVRIREGYLSPAAYAVIRSRKHDGPPPSSDDLVRVPADGSPVAPSRAGRVRATDTLLLDVAAGERTVSARLRIPAENPSLFDHAQDHVPAMVLTEAARQLAALATSQWGGPPPERTQMVALSSSFAAYAELNETLEMTATRTGTVSPAGRRSVDVTFRQAGTDIAQAQIVIAVPPR